MASYFIRSSVTGSSGTIPSPFNPGSISSNLVPVQDNFYSIGTPQNRWNSLQLGTGGLFLSYPPIYTGQNGWYSLPYDTGFIKWIQSSIVKGFWSSSAFPAYSNIVINKNVSVSFFGGVALNNGKVILVANNYSSIGMYNPYTDTYSDMMTSQVKIPPNAFNGGVLVPSGKVVFVPFKSGNVCVYVNESVSMSNTFSHNVKTPAFCGGVLDFYGNVVMIPCSTTSNICTYNEPTNTFSNAVFIGADGTFAGGVLYQNNVCCIPQTNSNVCVFSPSTQIVSNIISTGGKSFCGGVLTSNSINGYNIVLVPSSGNVCVLTIGSNYTLSNIVTNVPGPNAFKGGCLLPTGNVIMAPYNSANVGMVDPILMTYSNSTPVPPSNPFAGATLVRDGRVVLIPAQKGNVGVLNTITPPQNTEFWLSPYFNKF